VNSTPNNLVPAHLDELLLLLRDTDLETNVDDAASTGDPSDLVAAFGKYFSASRESTRAVLGLDIYKYSKYDSDRQRLIPVLFQYLHLQARTRCIAHERYLFQNSDLEQSFVPTGDGGFQILDTPLHALVFAIYFQLHLHAYNASYVFPKLRRYLGPLTIRYAATYDKIFHLDSNFFGAAIINNARILARDTLNRFLFDSASVGWFEERIGSLETLTVFGNDELPLIHELAGYDPSYLDSAVLFPIRRPVKPLVNSAFRVVAVQKIGTISAKGSELDVYNAYLQVKVTRVLGGGRRKPVIVTLGNLNTAGIAE